MAISRAKQAKPMKLGVKESLSLSTIKHPIARMMLITKRMILIVLIAVRFEG